MSESITTATDFLKDRKTLLIFEAKKVSSEENAAKLAIFVKALMKRTNRLKMVIIHEPNIKLKLDLPPCTEEEVYLEPLNLDTNIDLFCQLLPSWAFDENPYGVSSLKELSQLLKESVASDTNNRMTKRVADICQMIGEGVPKKIHEAAELMTKTPEDLDKLITLAKQSDDETLECMSRSELVKKLNDYIRELALARVIQDFSRCKRLHAIISELEQQKKRLPHVWSLEQQLYNKSLKMVQAASSDDYDTSKKFQSEIRRLQNCLQLEKDAEIPSGIIRTRYGLEKAVLETNNSYEKAIGKNDYQKAEMIRVELEILQQMRSEFPLRINLLSEIPSLEKELERAKTERKPTVAQIIHDRITQVKKRVELEEKAECEVGFTCDIQSVINQFTVDRRDAGSSCESDQATQGNDILKPHKSNVKELAIAPANYSCASTQPNLDDGPELFPSTKPTSEVLEPSESSQDGMRALFYDLNTKNDHVNECQAIKNVSTDGMEIASCHQSRAGGTISDSLMAYGSGCSTIISGKSSCVSSLTWADDHDEHNDNAVPKELLSRVVEIRVPRSDSTWCSSITCYISDCGDDFVDDNDEGNTESRNQDQKVSSNTKDVFWIPNITDIEMLVAKQQLEQNDSPGIPQKDQCQSYATENHRRRLKSSLIFKIVKKVRKSMKALIAPQAPN
jgi:hypothetical protein